MLFITERRTTQTDLIQKTVLHMVSLFVVAYEDEVEKFAEDDFRSFVADARSKGFLILNKPEDEEEFVEVSRTRKGFLIKISYTELLSETPKPEPAPEVFKNVLGFPNYEFSNRGNLRNVNTGKLIKRDGNAFKVSRNGYSYRVNLAELERLTRNS